jgi:aspartyl-tRNA(Asn)/glutamyl-tRNA(Gln) amidotransferase subunit C
MEIKDIEKLAALARIDLTREQKQTYLKEIEAILSYVDQIKGVVANLGDDRKIGDLHNVMRLDEVKNMTESNTEALVNEFPRKEDNYLKVKKILEN